MAANDRSEFGTIEPRERKNGRSWRAKYRHSGRYWFSETYRTKAPAQAWLLAEKRLVDSGEWTPWPERKRAQEEAEARKGTLVVEYARDLQKRKAKRGDITETTLNTYLSIIDQRFGGLAGVAFGELTEKRCERWMDSVRDEYPETQKRNADAFSILRSVCRVALKDGLVEKNPFDHLKFVKPKAKEKEVASVEELGRLADKMPPCHAFAVPFLGACGLRVGEMIELRRKDLVYDKVNGIYTVHVSRQYQREIEDPTKRITLPKGGKVRKTLMPPSLNSRLSEHLKNYAQPGDEGLVFPAISGGRLVRQDFGKEIAAARKAAGISKALTPHSLRHTAGTLYAHTGATEREIMEHLGHSDAEVARIYQHVASERPVVLARLMGKIFSAEHQLVYPIEYNI